MRKEYDFSGTHPNKYAAKYKQGANLALIEPDLLEFFPHSNRVNAALRALTTILQDLPPAKRKAKRRATLSKR